MGRNGGSVAPASVAEIYQLVDNVYSGAPTNYERLTFGFNGFSAFGSDAYIGTEKGGTGANRALILAMGGAEIMRLHTNGNVGIGTATPQATLDVNGYAKLKINSSAPATCNGTTEGSLAYTGTTTHYMCYCDGTSWKQVHSPATACTW
jgi:hypothetical protein